MSAVYYGPTVVVFMSAVYYGPTVVVLSSSVYYVPEWQWRGLLWLHQARNDNEEDYCGYTKPGM